MSIATLVGGTKPSPEKPKKKEDQAKAEKPTKKETVISKKGKKGQR
jgi:hypothetical protein